MGLIVGCFGERGNFLESLVGLSGAVGLAGGVPVIVTNEDSLYPRANLFDGVVANPFKFGSIAADCSITADLNLVNNGGAELNAMTGWTNVGSSPTTSTTQKNDGTYAFRITTNGDAFYQVVYLRAGATYRFQGGVYGGGGAVQANIGLLDLRSGAALVSTITRTAASWAVTGPTSFTVPAFSTGRYDMVPVQISCTQSGGAGTTYYDSIYLWPAWDFVSVHGHNIQQNLSVELRRDTAAFAGAGTLIATMTQYRPAFYSAFAQVTDRYMRLKLTGTVGAGAGGAVAAIGPTYIGELVVSQRLTSAAYPSFGYPLQSSRRVVRPGAGRAFIADTDERRRIALDFRYRSGAEYTEARDFLQRSAFGGFPLVVVPDDADPQEPELVLYGRPDAAEWERQRAFLHVRDAPLLVVEDPFPTFVA